MSSGYRMELRRHVADVQNRFGNYVGTPFETGILDDSSLSDSAVYSKVKGWRDSVDMAYRSRQEASATTNMQHARRYYHIVPMRSGNDITFVDVNGNGMVHVMKEKDGYSLMGPSDMIEILGGRGLGAQIFHMMQDGEYFHDKKLMHHNTLNNGAQQQTYEQY